MTEQEFRELTAYQPPSPPPKAHGPTVASVAAAVAAVKAPTNNAAQEPPLPEPITYAPAPPQTVEPVQMPLETQIQTTAQALAQAQGQVYASPQADSPSLQNNIQPARTESITSAPHNATFEMVPQQQHEELQAQYTRLLDRFKSLVEERDALSRQVSELKRTLAEQEKNGPIPGRDYKEEIRLLGKLIDSEQALRTSAAKPGDYLYERHDKLLNVFLNIVARTE